MEYVEPMFDKYNIFIGIGVAIMSHVFGEHWRLFGGFLLLNIFDWITGWTCSHLRNEESSQKGFKGVLKKFVYWVIIATAFLMSAIFVEIGRQVNVNLHVTELIGWFVLCSLIVNEFRSIIENFERMPGINVPRWLTKGLEVAEEAIDKLDGISDDEIMKLAKDRGLLDEEAEEQRKVDRE